MPGLADAGVLGRPRGSAGLRQDRDTVAVLDAGTVCWLSSREAIATLDDALARWAAAIRGMHRAAPDLCARPGPRLSFHGRPVGRTFVVWAELALKQIRSIRIADAKARAVAQNDTAIPRPAPGPRACRHGWPR